MEADSAVQTEKPDTSSRARDDVRRAALGEHVSILMGNVA